MGFVTFSAEWLRQPCLWIHAASLGEVKASASLLSALKELLPEVPVVFSVTTSSGYAEAKKRMPEGVIYLPLDFPLIIRRVLHRINLKLLILIETELWPNLIYEAKKNGAKVMVVNGRFSEKASRQYARLKGFFRAGTAGVDCWAMRSDEDKQRAVWLGVPKNKIQVTGNIKFQPDAGGGAALFMEKKLWVAGSTREGEERLVLEAYKILLRFFPELKLVLAPRHLQRVKEVEALLQQSGLSYQKRTELSQPFFQKQIMLLDTHGELMAAYQSAWVTFVGGSLLPYGGHNVLEPAACGKPVMFGPYTDHFKEEAQLLVERGVGFVITDSPGLARAVSALLSDSRGCTVIAERAQKIFEEKKEIVKKYAVLIAKLWKETVL
jgi:3-deoxy-D-manno-octulosonic-acid transferase